jgi:hypothetical protein
VFFTLQLKCTGATSQFESWSKIKFEEDLKKKKKDGFTKKKFGSFSS